MTHIMFNHDSLKFDDSNKGEYLKIAQDLLICRSQEELLFRQSSSHGRRGIEQTW